MAADKERREVEILLNAQQANASIKDMAAGVALMNNQLAKMGQDDPRRAQLQRDFQVLTQRVGAARTEMRTYVQTEEEVRVATEKMNQENLQVILNGQKLNSSFKDMKASAALLEKQLHELSSDDPGRKKMLDDYQQLQHRIAGVKKEMGEAEQQGSLLKEAMAFAGVTVGAEAVLEGMKELGAEIVNTTKEVAELRSTINTMTGATGEELDGLTTSVLAVSRTFGKDFNEVLVAGNALSKQMGVSQQEAMRLIQQGFLAGADAGGDFLDQVKEYAPQFKNAGFAADEFIGHISQSATQGIFSDKGADVVKEFGLRIREQTKSTSEAMQAAFGADFTKEIFDGINNGSLTVEQALQRVGKELDETKIPANQLQTVIADVFGGPGEDAGIDYLKSLKNVGKGVDDLVDKTNVYTQRQERLLTSQTELAEAQNDLTKEFEGGGSILDTLTNKSMTVLYTLLASLGATFKELFAPVQEIWKSFTDLAESMGWLSAGTLTAKSAGQALGDVIRIMFTPTRLLFGAISDIVKATVAWSKSSENARNYLQLVALPVRVLYDLLRNGPAYFQGFSAAAEASFGTLGRAWKKVKEGDFSGAKEEFSTLGKTAGDAYRTAFASASTKKADSVATTQDAGDVPAPARAQGGNGQTAAAREKAAKDAQAAREKARKERKAAQDKADQERLNSLKSWVKDQGAVLDAKNVLDASRDSQALSDEAQRAEAQRQKLFEVADKKVAALTGQEHDYAEQVQAIVAERDLALRELATKFAEDYIKQRKADFDQQIQDNEADSQLALVQAEITHLTKLTTVQAYEDAMYEIKRAAAVRELALVEQRDGQEAASAKKLQANLLRSEAEHVARTKAQQEDFRKFDLQMASGKAQLLREGLQLVENNLNQQSTAYQIFKAARKTAELAELGINLQAELSANAKAAAQNPLNGVTAGAAGATQLIISDGLSIVRAVAGGIKIAGFAKGGATGSGLPMTKTSGSPVWDMVTAATGLSVGGGGQLVDAQGLEVAGIVHKNEYVIPEWLRQDPQVIQVEDWLEARRQRGFYQGGPTTEGDRRPLADAAAGQRDQTEEAAGNQQLVRVLTSLDQRLQEVEKWPTQFEVVLDLLGLDREQEKIKKVRTRSSIGPK